MHFLRDKVRGKPRASVARGFARVVLLAAALQVVGDAGVERTIRAAQNVQEPDLGGRLAHALACSWPEVTLNPRFTL